METTINCIKLKAIWIPLSEIGRFMEGRNSKSKFHVGEGTNTFDVRFQIDPGFSHSQFAKSFL